ncbi:MAG TPA: hypothetical protein VNL16_08085 [Chloroflexota bacterium]|nr:hypothetical protein [Chloroflexota bacterium]
MPDDDDITAADLEALARAFDLVPVPADLLPRVLEAVREHRRSLRRFAAAGIELRDVFPSEIYRA